MEVFSQIRTVIDKNNRKGVVLEKEKKYWKAWFHRNIQRWNPVEYGEEGQNFEEWVYNDKSIEFVVINLPKYGSFHLEMSDFRKFYSENPNVKDTIFQSKRFLFPLGLCKKITEETK